MVPDGFERHVTMRNSQTELELLLDATDEPVFVSIAADELVLEQNVELRECLAGRLVARREVKLSDAETESVGFYSVPARIACRRSVLEWFWSAEQLRLLACCYSPEVFDRLGDDMLFELASCSDRRLLMREIADSLRECTWSAFHDHSDRSDSLCVVHGADVRGSKLAVWDRDESFGRS